MSLPSFPFTFENLTGNPPFPWQTALYGEFAAGKYRTSANIPTGLGKTSIVAIWLIALALQPLRVPRRLVYVVNRRTVVDQTTTEVERLRKALAKPELTAVRDALASLCALPLPTGDASPLVISTLRGQFADNGEWCADPSRPAVVVGTVDMIGSGLLFSRYTRGFKTRPLYAGFLAQDALLVHDEAHLEPSFQKLIESIVSTQNDDADSRKLRVIELTATSRAAKPKPFGLDENPDDKDTENEIVKKRINAVKRLSLVLVSKSENGKDKANDGTVRDNIIGLALAKKSSGRAMLIFVRSVDAAVKIANELGDKKCAVTTLTGTMRGKERDELVSGNAVFQRFLPEKDRAEGVTPTPGSVFLVATSAGEVGVNISADDLICDLSTYESMAQRFGRVNRFGERKEHDASEITVFYRENLQANYDEGLEKAKAAKKDPEKKVAAYEKKNQSVLRIIKTLALLTKLNGDASPAALDGLAASERTAAFSPPPDLRVATGIQFDAWALTSIREPIAARPIIAPYLHGEAEWQPPETHIAWREELDVLDTPELRAAYPPGELLEDFPLKPHELLRDTSERIFNRLVSLLRKRQTNGQLPDAWLVRENGDTEVFPLTRFLSDQEADTDTETDTDDEDEADGDTSGVKKAEKERRNHFVAVLADSTLILPASLGGIDKNGLLTPDASGDAGGKADVADIVNTDSANKIPAQRRRVWSETPDIPTDLTGAGFRLVRAIDTLFGEEDSDASDGAADRYWIWLEAKSSASGAARFAQPETLTKHTNAVIANAAAIAAKLFPDASALAAGEFDLCRCLVIAARLHDLGKNRAQWQRNLGNLAYDLAKPETILAKSAPGMRPRNLAEHYRHEFGSLSDACLIAEFADLSDTERDIVLHLVAAHHGRARPHFPAAEIFDYSANDTTPDASRAFATEVPRRFARLQKRFGRWGLAWLESLLRAADYAASAGILAPSNDAVARTGEQRTQTVGIRSQINRAEERVTPSATLAINPANPGHYFACCGLFELAARLAPDALAWFEQDPASRQWLFHLANTPSLADLLERITAAEITASDKPKRENDAADDLEEESEGEEKDASAPPLLLGGPFYLRLDWWKTATRNTSALKVWAGSMDVLSIARSMSYTLAQSLGSNRNIENVMFEACVAYDPLKVESNRQKSKIAYEKTATKAEEKRTDLLKKAEAKKSGKKLEEVKSKISKQFEEDILKAKSKRDSADPLKDAKKEPFYFDANRGPNAHSRDVGFAANDLNLETLACPAVELLTLVGLQRSTPKPVLNAPRNFEYRLWTRPLSVPLLPAALNGLLPDNFCDIYRFESWFRTGQRKHKAFLTARTVSSHQFPPTSTIDQPLNHERKHPDKIR